MNKPINYVALATERCKAELTIGDKSIEPQLFEEIVAELAKRLEMLEAPEAIEHFLDEKFAPIRAMRAKHRAHLH